MSATDKRGYVAKRIDLAVIEDDLKLRLIEVKIDTDGRLRSDITRTPKVLSQMKYYKEFIENETINILGSYKSVAQNYIDLDLSNKIAAGTKLSADTLSEFVKGGQLDLDPVLLVIETGRKKVGRNEIDHWKRLLTLLDEKHFNSPRTWPYPS